MPRVLDAEIIRPSTWKIWRWNLPSGHSKIGLEPWEVLKGRTCSGFEAIAKEVGAKMVEAMPWWSFIVEFIQTFVCLIEGKTKSHLPLPNGSVTLVEYEDGELTVKGVGDSSYREVGENSARISCSSWKG